MCAQPSVQAVQKDATPDLSSLPPEVREALKECRDDEEGRAHVGDVLAHFQARKGVVTIAAKEKYPATALLDLAMAHADAVPPKDTLEDPVTIHLWELALKLRLGEVYCRAVLAKDCVAKMGSVVCAEPWGGWAKIISETTAGETWPFCSAWSHAEVALSVVHELCRYRSGCEAVASDAAFLKKLAAFPLDKAQAVQAEVPELIMNENCRSGSLEQALIDTLGRCVAGVVGSSPLGNSLKRVLRRSPLLDQLAKTAAFVDNRDAQKREMLAVSKDMLADDRFDAIRKLTTFVDRRFLTHATSLANLRAMLSSKSSSVTTPWKSSFCMERHTIAEESTKAHLRTIRRDAGLACRVCGKTGRVADKTILRCGRCKIATYCSATCQRKDWPSHKTDCVHQRPTTTLPGNELHKPADTPSTILTDDSTIKLGNFTWMYTSPPGRE